MPNNSTTSRTARCLCGALTATARGEPATVYLCACVNCQIKSGSAFSHAAVYPAAAVTIAGVHNAWRYTGESGRWIENHFCPACGVAVFFSSEGLPGAVGIAAGCFADDAGVAHDSALTPQRIYWAERRRDWVRAPKGVEEVGRQWASRRRRVPRLGESHRQHPADRKQDSERAEEAQHAEQVVDVRKIVEDQPNGDRHGHGHQRHHQKRHEQSDTLHVDLPDFAGVITRGGKGGSVLRRCVRGTLQC
jgi:hypothetical protein